ncbi:hypothetical protein OAA06_01140 [bacterium]|nr:hypothetical protein [bacterium]
MTTITIIVILIIASGFSYFILKRKNIKYFKEHKEIFDAHKNLGYPKISNEDQFNILDNEDLTSIKEITKYDFIPTGLLNYYITIEPDSYFEHLRGSGIIEQMDIDKLDDKLTDGFYIERKDDLYKYIFNDRRSRIIEKDFKTEYKLLKYLVYSRLRLYAPKYKRIIRRKYYA